MKRVLSIMSVLLLLASANVYGYSVNVDQVVWQAWDTDFDSSLLAATLEFQGIDGNTFSITLTNVTSYPGSVDNFDFPSTVAATGIFFNLFDYDICGGSVVGPNADGGDEIVSAYWGYNNGYKSLEAFEQPGVGVLTSWDTVVSTLSGSLTKTYGATFTGSTDFGPVDGPPHGVLPLSEGYPANKTDYLYGYASIIIDLNNDVDDWETFFPRLTREM